MERTVSQRHRRQTKGDRKGKDRQDRRRHRNKGSQRGKERGGEQKEPKLRR